MPFQLADNSRRYTININNKSNTENSQYGTVIDVLLNNPIILSDTYHIFIAYINKFSIPYTVYVINDFNRFIYVQESDEDGSNPQTPFFITLDLSNKNAILLADEIKNKLNLNSNHGITYAVQYNREIGKYIFSTNTPNKKAVFNFNGQNNAYKIMGFNKENYEMTTTTALTSVNIVNQATNSTIYIKTSILNSNSSYEYNDNENIFLNSNIIKTVHFQVEKYQMQVYNAAVRDAHVLGQREIKNFSIGLYDEENNEINLNGVDFSITLTIEEIQLNLKKLLSNEFNNINDERDLKNLIKNIEIMNNNNKKKKKKKKKENGENDD